ncbi:MAG: hypothetical protein J6X28_04860 [Bacilli bacterium]|nr:hypothetical protein [Bacilli bacterium]
MIDKEDVELKELIQKIGLWFLVFILFGSLFVIMLVNKFGAKEIAINQKLEKQSSLVILVTTTKIKNNREIKNELNVNGVSYEVVYRDRERYFSDFLRKVDLQESDIIEPTILYVEEKVVVASLTNIKDIKEIKPFLESNNLLGKG